MVQADGIDQLLRQPPLRGEEPADERVIDAIRLHHRSEEHTSELQSHHELVCGLLLEKKKGTLASGSYGKHGRPVKAERAAAGTGEWGWFAKSSFRTPRHRSQTSAASHGRRGWSTSKM